MENSHLQLVLIVFDNWSSYIRDLLLLYIWEIDRGEETEGSPDGGAKSSLGTG